ncbi:hypothetical protein HJG54_09050 [Leptolyngbya sp. NK1-12]|uniref:Lipoprotein n=1 Tax=Leptolyngbya sp. NK1-12 TaxID=2547451 RepID=A0AA97AG26_9CYAN|nr:hypothetical protein [Leptolyngbya sp. NK1-12]WNZ22994.1 hypothetical protein HJG54_09050 [Leptolyngbya sp. NK1-12]
MKPRQAIYLLLGIGLSISGCTSLGSAKQAATSDTSLTAPVESPAESPVELLAENAGPSSVTEKLRPDTRIMPMTIEGEVVEMELRLFDQSALPFTTYVPKKDFQDKVDSSDQGTVAQFIFSPGGKKDETAYVQIFMPSRRTTVEEMRELLLSENGLLATNNWELVDRTDIVSYAWAREKLIYQQRADKTDYFGSIYIGDYQGRSFYALTHYPAEYGDGFEPRSTIMLENLQFRDERS